MRSGLVAGFPVTDIKAVLFGGAYHDSDSTALAFEIAARAAAHEGLTKAGPKLLQPIMDVAVATPPAFLGDVIGDLQSRKASALTMGGQDIRVILAKAPLANLFGYDATLSSMSQGQAAATIRFNHYAEVPRHPDDDPYRPAPAMAMRIPAS